jgi:hypothetical protein
VGSCVTLISFQLWRAPSLIASCRAASGNPPGQRQAPRTERSSARPPDALRPASGARSCPSSVRWVNPLGPAASCCFLYDVLCKHHSQSHRVARSTNMTHKYSANPLRSCSSKTIASFCWNGTASGIGSPDRQLSKQTRSQVHCKQARDHQQRHPYPLQHYRQHSEPSSRLLKQFCLVGCRIASY